MRLRHVFAVIAVFFFIFRIWVSDAFSHGAPQELLVSLEARERMNNLAASYGLRRLENIQILDQLVCVGAMVRVEVPRDHPIFELDLNSTGIQRYPFLRPFAHKMLFEIASDFFERRRLPFKITSTSRTVPYQKFLESGGVSDAAERNLKLRSAHPDGNAFDIAKSLDGRLMNHEEIDILRDILAYREREGAIDAIEERGSFHVTVSPTYAYIADENFVVDAELIAAKKDICPLAAVRAKESDHPVKNRMIKRKSPTRKR